MIANHRRPVASRNPHQLRSAIDLCHTAHPTPPIRAPRYYSGRIARDNRDGTYDIDYDDGEKERGVREELIRSLEATKSAPRRDDFGGSSAGDFREGDKVEARYRGKSKYYPGRIGRDNRDGTYVGGELGEGGQLLCQRTTASMLRVSPLPKLLLACRPPLPTQPDPNNVVLPGTTSTTMTGRRRRASRQSLSRPKTVACRPRRFGTTAAAVAAGRGWRKA